MGQVRSPGPLAANDATDSAEFCMTRHLQDVVADTASTEGEDTKTISKLQSSVPSGDELHVIRRVTPTTPDADATSRAVEGVTDGGGLERSIKRGKFTHASWRALARCNRLQFESVLGPSKQVRNLAACDSAYARNYLTLIQRVASEPKLTELQKAYPHEYNSYRSRKHAARNTHTGFHEAFKDFREWLVHLGPRPESGWTVDNIRGTKKPGYAPGNVRWLCKQGQRTNQRRYRGRVNLPDGRLVTTSQLARLVNLSPNTVSQRLRRGWTVQRILEESPSYRDTWTFPPDLMGLEPFFRRRRNKQTNRLDWAVDFLNAQLRGLIPSDVEELGDGIVALIRRLEAERHEQARSDYVRYKNVLAALIGASPQISA